MKKSSKVIAILLIIAVLICVASAIYLLIVNQINTYVVRQGSISKEDEAIGYIIRNEKVVKGEDFQMGYMQLRQKGKE